jgi:competence protein ComEA
VRIRQEAQTLLRRGRMIDINTASADEIDAIPQLRGHGFEIVRTREERGGFQALRQLEEVPGLAGKIAGLEGQISFG